MFSPVTTYPRNETCSTCRRPLQGTVLSDKVRYIHETCEPIFQNYAEREDDDDDDCGGNCGVVVVLGFCAATLFSYILSK